MKLYHGTSESRAKLALVQGIKPRGSKGHSNWKETVESNPKAVYLTDAYPLHFSINAAEDGERLAVIEVDTDWLDRSKLHPDEDVLEQAGRKYDGLPSKWSMKQRTRFYRGQAIRNPNWELSLNGMGTCAYYGTVPVKAFTRIAYMNPKCEGPCRDFYWQVGDTSVSLLNYRILAETHKARLRLLFGDPVTPKELDTFMQHADMSADISESMRKMIEERRAAYEAMIADRSAYEVVDLMAEKEAVA